MGQDVAHRVTGRGSRGRRGLAALALLLGLSAAVAQPATASASDQAVAYGLDAAHDGQLAHDPLGPSLSAQWSVALSGAISYPLIVNGAVFVTVADAGASGSTLQALSQATGSTLWSRELGGRDHRAGLSYDRGQLFALTSGGVLAAIDPVSGGVTWSVSLPGQTTFTSAPTASDGIVYVSGSGSGGTLFAVRERDGRVLWRQSVENGDQSSPAVDANSVYVTYAGQQDYAFDRVTGALRWHYQGPSEGGGGQTPVLADGLLFARDPVTGNLLLSASDASSRGSFSAGPAPAVAGGVAYLLNGSTLTAVTQSGQGTILWQFAGDGSLDTAPLVVGAAVYVGSASGELYALDPSSGAVMWSTAGGAAIPAPDEQNSSQPLTGMAAANGTLLVPAAGRLTAYRTAGALSSAPADQDGPTVDGQPQSGQLLGADVGVWSGLPSAYAYQWQRCDGAGSACGDIAGASGPSYRAGDADVGSTLRVEVTATNGQGSSAPLASSVSAPVLPPAPALQGAPSITGTAQQGQTLTAHPGTWSPAPTSIAYQWRRCTPGTSTCVDIAGAAAATYALVGSDVGMQIDVMVSASGGGGSSDPATSIASATVSSAPPPAPPSAVRPPGLSGMPQQGQTLIATTGVWTGSPTQYLFQWFSCSATLTGCQRLVGVDSPFYTLDSTDVGRRIGVSVVAANAGGESFSNSPLTSAVQSPPSRPVTPPVRLALGSVRAGAGGTVTLVVSAPGPGTLAVLAQWHARAIEHYGSRSARASAAGRVRLIIVPTRRARAALTRARRMHVSVTVTFRPARGGAVRTLHRDVTVA